MMNEQQNMQSEEQAADASRLEGSRLCWHLDGDGVLVIAGTGRMPDWFGPSPVRPWEEAAGRITRVVLEEGVTSVGVQAFRDLPALVAVVLPDTLRRIGHASFAGCTLLRSIRFPEGAILRHVYGEEASGKTLSGKEAGSARSGPGTGPVILCGTLAFMQTAWAAEQIGEFWVNGHTLQEYYGEDSAVHIPEGITAIGPFAFANRGISSVTFPQSLERIGAFAFENTMLRRIILPGQVKTVEDGAFSRCGQLRFVLLENAHTRMEKAAITETPVLSACPTLRGRCRKTRQGTEWNGAVGLTAVKEKGITKGRRMLFGITHRIGTPDVASKWPGAALLTKLRRGQVIIRIGYDPKTMLIDFVQSFALSASGEIVGYLMDPYRLEEHDLSMWGISRGEWEARREGRGGGAREIPGVWHDEFDYFEDDEFTALDARGLGEQDAGERVYALFSPEAEGRKKRKGAQWPQIRIETDPRRRSIWYDWYQSGEKGDFGQPLEYALLREWMDLHPEYHLRSETEAEGLRRIFVPA